MNINGDIIGIVAGNQGTQLIKRAIQHAARVDILFLPVDVDAERSAPRYHVKVDVRAWTSRRIVSHTHPQ